MPNPPAQQQQPQQPRNVSPDEAVAIAIQLYNQSRFPEAEEVCRKVLAVAPNHVEALHVLGLVAHRVGRNDLAVQILSHVAANSPPTRADVYNNLGEAYRLLGRAQEAVDAYRAAIARDPQLREPYNNIGIVLALTGQHSAAVEAWRRAIEIDPDNPAVHNNLGNLLQVQGRIEEAVAEHRRSVELAPDNPWNNSNLLRDLTYSDSITPQELLAEHRAWWDRHGKKHAAEIVPHANDSDPDRKLRVGFLSPDFRAHSVAYFLEPVFAEHEREKFDFLCYAELARPDEVSQRLQQLSEGWRSTVGVSDAAIAQQIREDKIDILIDVAGHTANTRIAACAFKPAPVQMTFLGYPFSTGLATIDYRITDAYADPPGRSEEFYVERLLRMPRTAWCYRPPAPTPAVAEASFVKNGFITFGSFNNLAKLTPAHAGTWARILQAVRNSRLLLKSAGLGDSMTHDRIVKMFTDHGVDPSRLMLAEYAPGLTAHLERYGEVDIGLDTFPYHGTTTTCEAMWMGVPVVTLAGPIHLSRVGVSLLNNVGLGELVADDADDYVKIAVDLAKDMERLRSLRSSLRERMKESPLCDAKGFTRSLEALLREAWREWSGAKRQATQQL